MANTTARFVYEALLSHDATPEVLRRVYAYADRMKDTDLLVSLTAHPKLDAELESMLAARSEADVLSAWAGRPGRTTEQLIARFAKEKRATLLTSLAQRSDLPEELYNQLANSGLATVCEALALNANAPLAARVDAAGGITRRIKDTYNAPRQVRSLLGECPQEVIDAAALGTTRFGVMAGLVEKVTPEVSVEMARLAPALAAKVEGWGARHLLSDFWTGMKSPVARQAFKDAVVAYVAQVDAGNATLENSYLREYATVDLNDPIANALLVLENGGSDDEIREAFKLTIGSSYGTRSIAANLGAKHACIPLESLLEHIRQLEAPALQLVVARLDGDLAKAGQLLEHGDSDVFDALVAHGFDLEALIRALHARMSHLPYWVHRKSEFYRNTALVIDLLGVTDVLRYDSGTVAATARALILERLGENPEMWEMFERLAPEWSGSLPALLDAVIGLSAHGA
jgi:hypothetical protein